MEGAKKAELGHVEKEEQERKISGIYRQRARTANGPQKEVTRAEGRGRKGGPSSLSEGRRSQGRGRRGRREPGRPGRLLRIRVLSVPPPPRPRAWSNLLRVSAVALPWQCGGELGPPPPSRHRHAVCGGRLTREAGLCEEEGTLRAPGNPGPSRQAGAPFGKLPAPARAPREQSARRPTVHQLRENCPGNRTG